MASSSATGYPAKPGASKAGRGTGAAAVFTICFVSSLFGGVVSTLMSVYLPVSVKDLIGNVSVDKLNAISATINSVFIFGWMCGGIVWGIVCDRAGRSRTVVLSTLCFGLFTLLTAAAPSWFLVSVCRFFSGFGVGGVLVTTTILVSETWVGKQRAVALGILSISIPVGIFSAGLINYFLPGWREAFLIGAVPLALAIGGLFVLREPAGWTAARSSRADRPSGSSGAGSSRSSGAGGSFFAPEYRANLWKGSVIFGAMLIGMWAIFSWLPTWVQSLSGVVDAQRDRGVSMMMMGAGGLTGGFVSGWVVHAIGLRRTMLLCFAVCFGMSCLLFKLNSSFSVLAHVEIAVMAVFFGVSQGALSVFIPELFPTAICAAATGFCFNVGRLFTATAVFFVGALVGWLGGYSNTLFIFSFIFIIGLLATLYAGEKTHYGTHQFRKRAAGHPGADGLPAGNGKAAE
jgi:MFS family permease